MRGCCHRPGVKGAGEAFCCCCCCWGVDVLAGGVWVDGVVFGLVETVLGFAIVDGEEAGLVWLPGAVRLLPVPDVERTRAVVEVDMFSLLRVLELIQC